MKNINFKGQEKLKAQQSLDPTLWSIKKQRNLKKIIQKPVHGSEPSELCLQQKEGSNTDAKISTHADRERFGFLAVMNQDLDEKKALQTIFRAKIKYESVAGEILKYDDLLDIPVNSKLILANEEAKHTYVRMFSKLFMKKYCIDDLQMEYQRQQSQEAQGFNSQFNHGFDHQSHLDLDFDDDHNYLNDNSRYENSSQVQLQEHRDVLNTAGQSFLMGLENQQDVPSLSKIDLNFKVFFEKFVRMR